MENFKTGVETPVKKKRITGRKRKNKNNKTPTKKRKTSNETPTKNSTKNIIASPFFSTNTKFFGKPFTPEKNRKNTNLEPSFSEFIKNLKNLKNREPESEEEKEVSEEESEKKKYTTPKKDKKWSYRPLTPDKKNKGSELIECSVENKRKERFFESEENNSSGDETDGTDYDELRFTPEDQSSKRRKFSLREERKNGKKEGRKKRLRQKGIEIIEKIKERREREYNETDLYIPSEGEAPSILDLRKSLLSDFEEIQKEEKKETASYFLN